MSRVKIVGIVNVTQDSFSDGGQFLAPEKAIARAKQLSLDGAQIVELGPASSHPDAEMVFDADQIARLEPVFDALDGAGINVSVDATKPAVQRYALSRGAHIINDVRGFPDPDIYRDLAKNDCRLVVMHALMEGETAALRESDPETIFDSVTRFFERRIATLAGNGIDRDRLILDPGMGFFLGTNAEASLAVLKRTGELRQRLELPIMISVSRKSFLRKITGRSIEQIGPATLAAELFAAQQGADYIRTHDVSALRDALKVTDQLTSENYTPGKPAL